MVEKLLDGNTHYMVTDKYGWTSYKRYKDFVQTESTTINEASIKEDLGDDWLSFTQ